MWILFWIQTVRLFDSVLEIFDKKVNIEKVCRRQQKHEQLPRANKDIVTQLFCLPLPVSYHNN